VEPGQQNQDDARRVKEGLQQRLNDAASRYAEQLQGLYEELQRPYSESTQNYARTFQEAWKNQRPEDAQKAYLTFFQELSERLSPKAGAEAQQRLVEAYRGYVREVQQIWGEVDLNSLDPAALVGVGQGLLSASFAVAAASR
jgi:predicted component of viral defense system (DUF524 family)